MLEFKNVYKSYASSNFKMEDISFKLNKNEVLGLIGKNGTGKSTILKMSNGLVNNDLGNIYYNNEDISKMTYQELRKMRKEVVYIFQNANLINHKTVYYHLSLIYKLNKTKINDEEIDEMLNYMEIFQLKNNKVSDLSGGQRQKVAIAMAILQKPKILLCDEISASLDYDAENEIYNLLMDIQKKYSISILMISHNLEVLKKFCDRILFIDNFTISTIIYPRKSENKDEKDYYKYVLEYLND